MTEGIILSPNDIKGLIAEKYHANICDIIEADGLYIIKGTPRKEAEEIIKRLSETIWNDC